ncbi:MAG: polymer-forming cytoskeletal protein [Lachnospiraceae bacterium]|nr:polymer-forming cytoskeletal protein [Lachnospiraceae bacterium]
MSFLKDLKEDLSQAVNELVDDSAKKNATVPETETEETAPAEVAVTEETAAAEEEEMVNTLDLETINEVMEEASNETTEEPVAEAQEPVVEEKIEEEGTKEMDNIVEEKNEAVATDEVTEITAGTVIKGDIETNGSINIYGKVVGNIKCLGKVSVTGTIVGTTEASEVFANSAKIEGDVISEGCVKVGNGTVIIGAVAANSAVIGGAVKGDIDVHGPVIVDATAVVKGDIKSRSVQINNGAVIDGRCSQCYADIDYESLFDDTFSK